MTIEITNNLENTLGMDNIITPTCTKGDVNAGKTGNGRMELLSQIGRVGHPMSDPLDTPCPTLTITNGYGVKLRVAETAYIHARDHYLIDLSPSTRIKLDHAHAMLMSVLSRFSYLV
jgi:hypothetical protein